MSELQDQRKENILSAVAPAAKAAQLMFAFIPRARGHAELWDPESARQKQKISRGQAIEAGRLACSACVFHGNCGIEKSSGGLGDYLINNPDGRAEIAKAMESEPNPRSCPEIVGLPSDDPPLHEDEAHKKAAEPLDVNGQLLTGYAAVQALRASRLEE